MNETLNSILVATDFSKCAENALSYAVSLAKDVKAKILLLSVLTTEKSEKDQSIIDNTLERYKNDYFEKHAVPYEVEIISSKTPKEKIIDVAHRQEVDMIVVGTHLANGLESVWGTTTMQLIQMSDIPVLSVPTKAIYKTLTTIALACDFAIREDFTPYLHHTLNYLKRFDATINILNVNKDTIITTDQARQIFRLDNVLKGCDHSFDFIDEGKVEDTLSSYIKSDNIDIVAIMPQRYTLFKKFFKKSLTDYLLQHSEISILTIKTDI